MTCIIASLETDDEVIFPGHQVNNLSLSFITELGACNNREHSTT